MAKSTPPNRNTTKKKPVQQHRSTRSSKPRNTKKQNQNQSNNAVREITLSPAPISKLKYQILALLIVLAGAGITYKSLSPDRVEKVIKIPKKITNEAPGTLFTRLGEILPKGPLRVIRMAGDKQGNFYLLNYGNKTFQIQKMSLGNKILDETKLDVSENKLARVTDFAADARGKTYILESDGRIHIFDKSLIFLRTLTTKVSDALALDLDSEGRIFVLGRASQEVFIFLNDGKPEMSFGPSPDVRKALKNSVCLTVTADGTSIVIENQSEGMKAKVFSSEGKLTTTFPIKEIGYHSVLSVKVGPKNRLFLNNHPAHGIYYYSMTGVFLGSASNTDRKDFISHPGGVFVNKWTGDIYVDFAPGFIRCRLP